VVNDFEPNLPGYMSIWGIERRGLYLSDCRLANHRLR